MKTITIPLWVFNPSTGEPQKADYPPLYAVYKYGSSEQVTAGTFTEEHETLNRYYADIPLQEGEQYYIRLTVCIDDIKAVTLVQAQ